MVEAFAAMLAVATRNAQLFSRERDAAWLSASLLRVAETAARPSDPDESLLAIVRLIPGLVQRSQALLWRPLRESEVLFPQASEGLNPAEAEAFRRARPGLSAFCPADLLGADEAAWPGEWTCPSPSETDGFFHHSPVQVLPLRYAGRLLGLLTIPAPAASGEALPQRESRERSFLLGLVHQLAMVLEAKRLNVELEAARRLEQEMEVAREIQVSFLPKELPQVEGWQMSASWRSAREVGGDFYDFFPLPPSAEKGGGSQPRWGVVIADVADKGVPAALFMALSRTLFRAAAISRVDPATTLARVNDLLFTDASAELFVTAFYAVWEPDSGRFTYANAGHNPPLVVPVGGHPRWLLEHGVALGVIEGSAYRTRSLHLRPGETLVLYTDGLLDAENPDHQPFGSSRLEWCVLESRNLSAEEISDSITRALAAHLLTEEPFDDMTWVVFRRRPLEPPVKGERPGAPGLEADREAPQAGPRISPLA
jgi:serine phosphatase RsbU (regulator of sigma subunit)